MRDVKRKYDSGRRRRQAEETKKQIVEAARRLFAEHGYAATTINVIAQAGQVAPQTVYAIFGSKRALLSALIDAMELEAELPTLLENLRAAQDEPLRQLDLIVDFNRRLFSRGLDVLEIMRSAAAAEPDLVAAWSEGEERRRQGQRPLVQSWHANGVLKPNVTVAMAADVLWTLTGPDVFRLLVAESGWSPRRYAIWLQETLRTILFRDS